MYKKHQTNYTIVFNLAISTILIGTLIIAVVPITNQVFAQGKLTGPIAGQPMPMNNQTATMMSNQTISMSNQTGMTNATTNMISDNQTGMTNATTNQQLAPPNDFGINEDDNKDDDNKDDDNKDDDNKDDNDEE